MAAAHKDHSFAAASFTSLDDMAARLVGRALALAPRRDQPRMLDLGCGSGAVAIAAAKQRPDMQIVALDIGAANVAAARARAEAEGLGPRVEAVHADYLSWRAGPFDLIVSDSVLYVVPGSDENLAACLAADLAPGGMLVVTMPIEVGCQPNTHCITPRLARAAAGRGQIGVSHCAQALY